jgi:acyl-CoA synthetase (NDP forming)
LKKIPAAVIASGGYAEVDEERGRWQKEIVAVAKESGMRIIGPNTSGLTSTPAALTTTFHPLGKIRRGPISYIAQTGNFATHTMRWILTAENFGVARVAGLGNKADVEDAEMLEFLGEDPETKAILMYVEGFREPRRFLQVARIVTKKKPVVIFKGGRTKAGAERAFSHTASLAGDDSVFDGAFRQAGIARVKRYADLINVAKAIAFQPLPAGRRVASLAPSGALGVVVADACEMGGLKMARFSAATLDELRKMSASWVKISNPVDMAAVTPVLGALEGYKRVIEVLLRDDGVDAVVPILLASPRAAADHFQFLPELGARHPGKPIYLGFTVDKQAIDGIRELREKNSIPVFNPMEDIFETLPVLCRCREVMELAKTLQR